MDNQFPMPDVLDLTQAPYTKAIARTNEELQKYWEMGRDFKILGGPYLSIRDTNRLMEMGVTAVMLWHGSRAGVEVKLTRKEE